MESNPERMIVSGVSSTMMSIPVAFSSARMFRPSRPMIRPFMSSLGRSTTDTAASATYSEAIRQMARPMTCLARSSPVSVAVSSMRLTIEAACSFASSSNDCTSWALASSAVRPATTSSFRCDSATTWDQCASCLVTA